MVEDHATLAGRIAQGLSKAGMAVDAVHDGAAYFKGLLGQAKAGSVS